MTQEKSTGRLDIGDRLRELRGGTSLRALAEKIGSSKSALSRLERRETLRIDKNLLARLDDYYGVQGQLVAAHRSELRGRWHAQAKALTWQRNWIHNFPASYSGPMHVELLLPSSKLPAHLGVQLCWGPWLKTLKVELEDDTGRTLRFSKGDDGLSIPLRIQLSRPGLALSDLGSGPPTALDINAGWVWTGE